MRMESVVGRYDPRRRHLDVVEVSAGRLGAFGSWAVAPYLSGKPDESGL